MSGKHGRQGLFNFLRYLDKVYFRFLLTKPLFRTEFVHVIVKLIYGFEILCTKVVPLMGGLWKDTCLLFLIPLLQSKPEGPWVLFHQILCFEIWMDVVSYDE